MKYRVTSIYNMLFEVVEEPLRFWGPSAPELQLLPSGGKENIRKVLTQANPSEREYWGKWYHHAQDDVRTIAEANGMPFEKVAAILAVLSPGTTWKASLTIAKRIIGDPTEHASAFPGSLDKARLLIHDEGSIDEVVLGPKVSVFYQSLVSPEQTEHDIVVDGHAINIWRGRIGRIRSVKIGLREKQELVEGYREIAKENGLSAQAVQAITWYIWKSALRKGRGMKVVIDTSARPSNDNADNQGIDKII